MPPTTDPAVIEPPRRGPLPGPLGRLCSRVYGQIMARRNRAFDAGTGVVTFDRPVISVGNLSVGGTGKTPLVGHLLGVLRDAGRRPCVAMRGYGSRAGRESDEAAIYRELFPDLPIVARPDRTEGLIELFASDAGAAVDVIVLDDGFQHRRIARRADLVLIDATRDPFTDALLPAGWLREPVESLRRASGVVLTHARHAGAASVHAISQRVGEITGRQPLAVCSHEWAGLRLQERTGVRDEPSEWLSGRRVVAACAIGNPTPFLAEVRRRVGDEPSLVVPMVLRDHDPYDPPTIARLLRLAAESRARAVVVTQKDWSKLKRVKPEAWPCPVVVPRLALRFESGRRELEQHVLGAADKPSEA